MSASVLPEPSAPRALSGRVRRNRPKVERRPRSRLGTTSLVIVLMGVVCVPSLPLYLLGASSMATGVLLSCVLALLAATVLHATDRTRIGVGARWIAATWSLVGLHFAVAMLLLPVDIARFAASWVLLLVFLVGARAVSGLIFTSAQKSVHRALKWSVTVLLLSAACGLMGLAPAASLPYEKPVFPFTEPSHFALSFVAFLMYFAVTSQGWRRLAWIGIGVFLALTLQNMTLLAGTILVALVCTFRVTIAVLPIVGLFVAPFVDLEYFATRLDFSAETDNLSSLVFVQGWQLMEESLRHSWLWGIGFQQLGLRGTEVPVSELIYALMATYVNLNDGGFTLSKLVSEFGLIGVAAAAAHLTLGWRCAIHLREHAMGRRLLPPTQCLACAVVVAFTLELFVRGAGYFTASSLLYAASVLHLLQTRASAKGSG